MASAGSPAAVGGDGAGGASPGAVLAFALWLVADAAEEGKKVITAMLIVGLVFVAVIALGEASKKWSHHRKARRPRRY